MIMKYKRAAHYIYFLFSRCYVYIMLPIWCKSWNRVYWLLLFLIRIKFGHAQISVPKIGVPISKIACINPWLVTRKNIEKDKCLGEILNDARQKNINQPIIGQLNINSIRKKISLNQRLVSTSSYYSYLKQKLMSHFPRHNFCWMDCLGLTD